MCEEINSGYHWTWGFNRGSVLGRGWLTQGTNKVPACPVQSPETTPHDDPQKFMRYLGQQNLKIDK